MVKAKPKTSKKSTKKIAGKSVKKKSLTAKNKTVSLKKKPVSVKKKSASLKKNKVSLKKKTTVLKNKITSVEKKKTIKSSKPASGQKKIFTVPVKVKQVIVEKVIKIKKYKPNKKIKFTSAELKHFREIILKERKAILESAKANMAALVDNESGEYKGDNLTYSTHMAEQGTDEMEREKNYLFVQRDEKYLGYLQDALMRIDQGTYGICIDCKDDPKNLCRTCPLIQKERLELVPITQHCIECKNLRG